MPRTPEKESEYIIFRRVVRDHGYWSFNGYTVNGTIVRLKRGTDSQDKPILFRIEFEPNQRDYKVHKDDTELLEFMRNYPGCEGGPNHVKGLRGDYAEYNENAEAEAANALSELALKAANRAAELKDEKLAAVAAIYGYLGKNAAKLKNTVQSAAAANPSLFLERADAADLLSTALFLRAEEDEVIVKSGVQFVFGSTKLGTSMKEVVELLESDPTVAAAIEKALPKSAKK